MTKDQKLTKIQKLREQADRYDESVSSSAGPSSQEWVSPERRAHYHQMAYDLRREANELERSLR